MENKEIVKILEAHKEWIEHPEKSKGKVNELILAQAIGIAVSKLNLLIIPAVGVRSEQLTDKNFDCFEYSQGFHRCFKQCDKCKNFS